jgi:hypothetical protein
LLIDLDSGGDLPGEGHVRCSITCVPVLPALAVAPVVLMLTRL